MSEATLDEMWEKKQQADALIKRFQSRKIEEPKVSDSINDSPVFDLYLMDEELYLDLELPGTVEDKLKVRVEFPYIIVVGEHPVPAGPTHDHFLEQKRRRGPFNYRFAIPEGKAILDFSQQYVHGVLHLKMKIADQEKQKKLTE